MDDASSKDPVLAELRQIRKLLKRLVKATETDVASKQAALSFFRDVTPDDAPPRTYEDYQESDVEGQFLVCIGDEWQPANRAENALIREQITRRRNGAIGLPR